MKMIKLLSLLNGILIVMTTIGLSTTHADESEPVERPLLLAHFMPWYQSPDVYGSWGWHWTMEHFNPDNVDDNGRREIASHYMPLTGPYDSSDLDILEYQVLLMKLSGIDGVIVDWYGINTGFRDYGILHESTKHLFEAVKRAGLSFVLCYEDQTVLHMTNENYLDDFDAALEQGRQDIQFAQDNWFEDDAYLKRDGSPYFFVFGPQYFRSPSHWEQLFAGLPVAPTLVTLDGHLTFAASASYPWPPMSYAGGATLSPAVLSTYFDQFYRNARRSEFVVGTAFPAFHDIYQQAGVRSSYGYLDPAEGETFRTTFSRALEAEAEIIQLATWNDYGEGTIIEPTEEFGYERLEIVQETRGLLDETFAVNSDALRLPLRLFQLRKSHPDDLTINEQLDAVFDALIAGDVLMAEKLLEEIEQ